MSSRPKVEVSAGADELARSVAERLVRHLAFLQRDRQVPSVVLTGGTIADRIHRAVPVASSQASVDWSRVELWFGDERFVPEDSRDRNARQAREAFLSLLPVAPARVHEMPASDGTHGQDVDVAAGAYAEELRRVLGERPRFDVLMLGIGPDGHCASLFPGHSALNAQGLVVAVRDSPKPPPTRISMTMDLLGRADEVWFVASGAGKAGAVRDAVTGSDVEAVPAAGPKGVHRTLWLLDASAAAELVPVRPRGT